MARRDQDAVRRPGRELSDHGEGAVGRGGPARDGGARGGGPEGGVAAGVRRVEAFTGEGALDLIRSYEQKLKEIGNLLRGSADDTVEKVKKLLDRQKELEREIQKLRGQFEKDQIPELLAKKQSFDGTNVLVSQVDGVDAKQLRDIADQFQRWVTERAEKRNIPIVEAPKGPS